MTTADTSVPSQEKGAATGVRSTAALSASAPSNNMMDISVYRRWTYHVNTSGQSTIHRDHEYLVRIALIPSGTIYEDATGWLISAEDIITYFRQWLLEEIENNSVSTEVARQYVALYNHTNHATNPSFRHQFQSMLDAAPATESSYEVDQLIAECVAAFGWTYLA